MNRHRAQRQKRTLLNLHPIASHIVLNSRHALTPLARKRIVRSGTVAASFVAAVGLTTVFAAAQQNPENVDPSTSQSRTRADIHALIQSSAAQAVTPPANPGNASASINDSNNASNGSSVIINGQQVHTGNGTIQKTMTDSDGNTTSVTVTINNSPASMNSSSTDSSINVDTYSSSYSNSFNLDNTTRGP